MRRRPWSIATASLLALSAWICSCTVSPPSTPVATTGADLAFAESPIWLPNTPAAGQSTTIACMAINGGTAPTASATDWTVQRDGVGGFASGSLPVLAAGATYNFSFSFVESALGTHSYTVILNPNGGVAETSTANNAVSITLSFTGPDIFAVGAMSLTPSNPTTTTPLTLNVQVSCANAITYTSLPWLVTADGGLQSWTGNFSSPLSATNPINASIILPANPVPGSHTYVFTVDPGNTFGDPDTLNNSASQSLNVLQSVSQ